MGENRAYPLWLYPRIHVHSRDPFGSLRTSSDWTISKPHGHPSAISQYRWCRIIKPLSVSAHLHSAIHNPRSYLYWVVGLFLDMSHDLCHPLISFHHAQPFYPCFIFSFRLCAPLIHSFPDSPLDVSLFISLTNPHAFVLRWFIRSHDPLLFRFAHKSFSHSLSLCFLIFSSLGRCSPIWANNRVDTSSHASLLHVFK